MTWRGTLAALVAESRRYARRNWLRLLRIRERLSMSEEAIHLLMAGIVGADGRGDQRAVLSRGGEGAVSDGGASLSGAEHCANCGRIALCVARHHAGVWRIDCGVGVGVGLAAGGQARLDQPAGSGRGRRRAAAVPQRCGARGVVADEHRDGGVDRTGGRHHAVVGDGRLEVGATGQMAAVSLAPARGLRGGGGAWRRPTTRPSPGRFFAAHIVLGNFSMSMFAPLLCASVVASVLSRSFFGLERWYEVPVFNFTSITQLPWFLILGFLAGGLRRGVFEGPEPERGIIQADSRVARSDGAGRIGGGGHRVFLSTGVGQWLCRDQLDAAASAGVGDVAGNFCVQIYCDGSSRSGPGRWAA